MKIKLLFVFLFFFIFFNLNGQSLRLRFNKGSRFDFYFNSLQKYEDGITYSDYSQIAISFSESEPKDSNWQVQIKALTATIDGGGTNTLPLDRLRVYTSDGGSTTSATYSPFIPGNDGGWFELTTVYQDIVQDGPEGSYTDNIVNISWDCGTQSGKKVSGYNSDYYVVDIDILVDIQ